MPTPDSVLRNTLRIQDPSQRWGVWDGQVESIDDFTRTGMVRVRVFLVHGPAEATPITALPWAEMAYTGGGYDWGEYDPPPVGTKVLVVFRNGRDDQPVVIGCVRGRPTDPQPMRALTSEEVEPLWTSPAGEVETPKDVFLDEAEGAVHPTKRLWRKSFKGFTFLVEERDGAEHLKILDRIGQVIEMNCPVSIEENKTLAAQRGTADAARDTQFEADRLADYRGFIRLRDVSGQEILLDGQAGNERVVLTNRNRSGSRTQTIEMSNKKGQEYVQITDQYGSKIRLAGNETSSIVLEDRRGSRVALNSRVGEVELAPAITLTETVAVDKNVEVGGDLNQVVEGSKAEQIVAHLNQSIGGDAATSVLGTLRASVGGPAQVLIGNAPTTGVPALDALQILLMVGGMKLQTLLGALKLMNCPDPAGLLSLGEVGIDPAGIVTAISGKASGTQAGLTATPAGTALLEGATAVQLGSVAAVEPLLKGATVAAALPGIFGPAVIACAAAGDPAAPTASAAAKAVGIALNQFVSQFASWLSLKVFTE